MGFIVASHMPGSSLSDVVGFIQCGLWFTLWSFTGLLTLPSIKRPGVLEADRFRTGSRDTSSGHPNCNFLS